MRKFKTAEENRTNYIYYFNDGSKCVITPGEDGENTTIIAQLHVMDDEQVYLPKDMLPAGGEA